MNYLILVCGLSLAGIAAILAWRLYLIRNLSKDELCRAIVSASPFFQDFDKRLRPTVKMLSKKFFVFICSKNGFKFLKRPFCRVSDYMNGRGKVKRNGCKGYWNKLNGREDSDKPA